MALGPLTVDFHEPGFVAGLNAEMAAIAARGFFDAEQKPRTGPVNPQALNRYAYVLNNPVRYTDPTGHFAVALALPLIALGLAAEIAIVVVAAVGTAVVAICAATSECRQWVGEQVKWGVGTGEAFVQSMLDALLDLAEDGVEWAKDLYTKATRQSGKEGSTQVPSWVRDEGKLSKKPGESGKDAAKRILDERYGPGKYPTGPGSEFSKIRKYLDRHTS